VYVGDTQNDVFVVAELFDTISDKVMLFRAVSFKYCYLESCIVTRLIKSRRKRWF